MLSTLLSSVLSSRGQYWASFNEFQTFILDFEIVGTWASEYIRKDGHSMHPATWHSYIVQSTTFKGAWALLMCQASRQRLWWYRCIGSNNFMQFLPRNSNVIYPWHKAVLRQSRYDILEHVLIHVSSLSYVAINALKPEPSITLLSVMVNKVIMEQLAKFKNIY